MENNYSQFQKLVMLIEKQLPQQVIVNRHVMLGAHYNGDYEFLDANIANVTQQLNAVKDGTHIELKAYKERGDDMFKMYYTDYQRFLIRQCTERLAMLTVNQINLSFSQN